MKCTCNMESPISSLWKERAEEELGLEFMLEVREKLRDEDKGLECSVGLSLSVPSSKSTTSPEAPFSGEESRRTLWLVCGCGACSWYLQKFLCQFYGKWTNVMKSPHWWPRLWRDIRIPWVPQLGILTQLVGDGVCPLVCSKSSPRDSNEQSGFRDIF